MVFGDPVATLALPGQSTAPIELTQKVGKEVKQAIEARKDARDLGQSQKLADRLEDNTDSSIDFALMAIAKAEMAAVDAVDPGLYATSLAQTEG